MGHTHHEREGTKHMRKTNTQKKHMKSHKEIKTLKKERQQKRQGKRKEREHENIPTQ